jgi:hypothetical protein
MKSFHALQIVNNIACHTVNNPLSPFGARQKPKLAATKL